VRRERIHDPGIVVWHIGQHFKVTAVIESVGHLSRRRCRSRVSRLHETRAYDHEQDFHDVVRSYLLTFFVASSVIADRNFVDDLRASHRAAEDLRVLIPASRDELVRFDKVTSINQVARIDIGEGHVVEKIEQQSDQTVSDFMGEILNSRIFGSQKAASQDDFRTKRGDWIEQVSIFLRRVFKVGILKQDVITGCDEQTGDDRGALSGIFGMRDDLVVKVWTVLQQSGGAIPASSLKAGMMMLTQIGASVGSAFCCISGSSPLPPVVRPRQSRSRRQNRKSQ
jgi:hypothetical protein